MLLDIMVDIGVGIITFIEAVCYVAVPLIVLFVINAGIERGRVWGYIGWLLLMLTVLYVIGHDVREVANI